MNPPTHRISEKPIEYRVGETWVYCSATGDCLPYWWKYYSALGLTEKDTHWTHSPTQPTHDPREPDAAPVTAESVSAMRQDLKAKIAADCGKPTPQATPHATPKLPDTVAKQPASCASQSDATGLREKILNIIGDADELAEQLDEIGWRSPCDAQWDHLRVWHTITVDALTALLPSTPPAAVEQAGDAAMLDWLLATEGSIAQLTREWMRIESPLGNKPYGDPKIEGRKAIRAAMRATKGRE